MLMPYSRNQQRQGTAVPCYVSMLLEDAALENKDQSVDSQRDFDIRWTANSLYAGKFFSSNTVYLRPLVFDGGAACVNVNADSP